MSDHSRDNPTSPDLLTLGVIVVLLSQLSSLHPWVAGLSTFLALAVLMALVALRGEPRTTALLCGIAALLGTGACWFFGSEASVSITVIASAIGTCTLATLSWLIAAAIPQIQFRPAAVQHFFRRVLNGVHERSQVQLRRQPLADLLHRQQQQREVEELVIGPQRRRTAKTVWQ